MADLPGQLEAAASPASSNEDDAYIEKNVHPILEKLGEGLALVMPEDADGHASTKSTEI